VRALLASGGIALFISLFATPGFIWLFKNLQWGQFIRDDGPQTHHTKRGTPTMGGIIILLGILVPTLLFAKIDNIYVLLMKRSSIPYGLHGKRYRLVGNRLVRKELSKRF
jgi:UDP-N-acetylmuramyl pentapeptide phosphotransferase/UDP-N-acetylglucosamine-1-phosphate transferase